MTERGDFSAPISVAWRDGRFAIGSGAEALAYGVRSPGTGAGPGSRGADPEGAEQVDAGPILDRVSEGWIIPGLVDAHVHAAWHAFDAADRANVGPAETRELTSRALDRTLRAGFTSVRDAGGLTNELLSAEPSGPAVGPNRSARALPRIARSITMIDRARADAAGGLDRAVAEVLELGARWVKLVATAGVAAPAGATLDPRFSATEVAGAVTRADAAGARVMVHAWGGEAIDFAIEAGAASIEHGMYLTEEQAQRAADAGVTFVPTVRIYRLVRRMIDAGRLPAAFAARVDDAIAHHPVAVRAARDAGMRIALGTDYGTTEQHGTNRLEFEALVSAGLTPEEALIAATRSGAELLAQAADPGAASDPGRRGVIADGAVADAVILNRDPREPGVLSDDASIVGVLLGGRWIDPHPPAAETAPEPR
ncbi:amidohydrolase family protein [Leucobacter sp. USHLN153]|uniref:amidohydrolase family protein n=1 Tax=Leucobacter sp. USHLN153 TaxID=3081268 RepID=UPI003019FD09